MNQVGRILLQVTWLLIRYITYEHMLPARSGNDLVVEVYLWSYSRLLGTVFKVISI